MYAGIATHFEAANRPYGPGSSNSTPSGLRTCGLLLTLQSSRTSESNGDARRSWTKITCQFLNRNVFRPSLQQGRSVVVAFCHVRVPSFMLAITILGHATIRVGRGSSSGRYLAPGAGTRNSNRIESNGSVINERTRSIMLLLKKFHPRRLIRVIWLP